MAQGIEQWAANLDERLEEIWTAPPPPAEDFKLHVGHRVSQLAHQVDMLAMLRPSAPRTVAEFHSGYSAVDRFVEHSAMLKFLGDRGLEDQYMEIEDDAIRHGEGVTSFPCPTTGQDVNWWFAIPDSRYPKGPIKYQFISQEGPEEGDWSYKMKVIASVGGTLDLTKKNARNRAKKKRRAS